MRHVEREIDNLLDRYLEGVLTTEEVRLLHRQLEDDLPSGEVQALLDNIELPNDLLNAPPPSVYKKEPKIYYKKALPKDDPNSRGDKLSITGGILLTFILFIALIFVVWPKQQRQKLFDYYFKPYSITAINEPYKTQYNREIWDNAVFKYNIENYALAAQTLEKLLNDDSDFNYIPYFYMGICYLRMQEPDKALTHFEQVTQGINPLKQQALWYSALAQIQLNDMQAAQKTLHHIINLPDFYNAAEAKALLQYIE